MCLKYMWILGVLIGKAIFDKISLDCRLNKSIIRQLCSQPIHFNDIHSFDNRVIYLFKLVIPFIEINSKKLINLRFLFGLF